MKSRWSSESIISVTREASSGLEASSRIAVTSTLG